MTGFVSKKSLQLFKRPKGAPYTGRDRYEIDIKPPAHLTFGVPDASYKPFPSAPPLGPARGHCTCRELVAPAHPVSRALPLSNGGAAAAWEGELRAENVLPRTWGVPCIYVWSERWSPIPRLVRNLAALKGHSDPIEQSSRRLGPGLAHRGFPEGKACFRLEMGPRNGRGGKQHSSLGWKVDGVGKGREITSDPEPRMILTSLSRQNTQALRNAAAAAAATPP